MTNMLRHQHHGIGAMPVVVRVSGAGDRLKGARTVGEPRQDKRHRGSQTGVIDAATNKQWSERMPRLTKTLRTLLLRLYA